MQTLIHYPIPAHLQKAYSDFKTRSLPATEKVAKRILSLPIYPGLTDEQVDAVIAGIREFYSEPVVAGTAQKVTVQ